MTPARHVFAIAAALVCASSFAQAGDLTKEECVDAHSRGQDAREQNKLSLARKLFLTCAQASCPALVQGDCARFADDLSRLQPTVTFVARDSTGADLPDTTVYVDGALIVTRLDGNPHDLDPGSHAVRFQSGGKERVVTIVLGSGEKGRTVVATFKGDAAQTGSSSAKGDAETQAAALTERAPPKIKHPAGAKALIYGGLALVAGGAALGVAGVLQLPSNCSLSAYTCASAPGDPSLNRAASAMQMANLGWALGAAGAAAIVGGTYWFVTRGKPVREHLSIGPWLPPSGGGLAVNGSL
jgi:hypothetical protein